MKIVVCIKQVPEVQDIQWTENNTIKREGVESVINPLDLYAIQYALKIKEQIKNVEIIAVSMGPIQAEKALKEAVSLGCDRGILLSDKKFVASDTLATSYVLSVAIKNLIKDYDLIICGQYAVDGDTAQTGVGIAENLNIPQITYVRELQIIDESSITLKKQNDFNFHVIKAEFPVLISVVKNEEALPIAKISRQIYAQNYEIKVYDAQSLGIDETKIGIKGSPTYVSKVFRPKIERLNKKVQEEDTIEFVENIIGKILNE